MKTLRLLLLAMSFGTVASASGVNLSWDDCGMAGTAYKTFACNTNSGFHKMVVSFNAPGGIDRFVAAEAELFLTSNSPVIPDWWQLRNQGAQVDQCRHGSVSTNAIFSTTACIDPWQGQAAGGIGSYVVGYGGNPRLARLLVVHAVPLENATPLVPESEYYAANILIGNQKSVGAGSCAGCNETVGIIANRVKVAQPAGSPGGDVELVTTDYRNFIGWQGTCQYVCTSTEGGFGGCFLMCTTPTLKTTWGGVKSIYR